MTDGASGAFLVARAMRVRGVFNDREIMPLGNRHDGAHIGGLAGKMDRDDGARARSKGGFDGFRIDVEGVQVDICKNGNSIGFDDSRRRGEEGIRRNNDFISGVNASRDQSDAQ